jgi:hypothetical protein
MLVGSASDVVYYGSSLDRDFNGCGYSSYTTNSPATDAFYTPNPATPYWDYRVVYDVYVNASALPAGWSVSIPYVHASPSKAASTYTIKAAPCPPLGCAGERCQTGGNCIGVGCISCVGERCLDGGGWTDDGGAGTGSGCSGEGCTNGGACYGLLCDSGSPTQCVGEGCTDGGTTITPGGGTWCTATGDRCTDNSACCSGLCGEFVCR